MKPAKKTQEKKQPGQALVLIDVINDFDFPRAAALLRYALPAAQRIAALKDARQACATPRHIRER